MEAAEVALYLFFTCIFASLLLYPASPVRHFEMYSRAACLDGTGCGRDGGCDCDESLGQTIRGSFQSSAHLGVLSVGQNEFSDALFYVMAQFSGAMAGACIARYLLRATIGRDAIRYAVTAPGIRGSVVAFIAELTISFVLMTTVLVASNRERLARLTPYFVGLLYAIFITLEAPLSGMSMNPARSFAPALHESYWHALWLYFTAPTLGMLVAAEVFLRARGGVRPFCAKLHHANDKRCIFLHGTSSPFRQAYGKRKD